MNDSFRSFTTVLVLSSSESRTGRRLWAFPTFLCQEIALRLFPFWLPLGVILYITYFAGLWDWSFDRDVMKIAIVGTGISGLVVGRLLCRDHDLTLFEANDHVGGHTNTVPVETDGQVVPVDTGFIVFNDRTYPEFIEILSGLGVESQPSVMSFSVRCEKSGLEYNGESLNAIFAQRRNLARLRFWGMLRDILRFNKQATELADQPGDEIPLGEFLKAHRYGKEFIEHYIIPMGSAIWSTDPQQMFEFPTRYFCVFFRNHGLLSINDRPLWRVIRGGSHQYVAQMSAPFRRQIRRQTAVRQIQRLPDGVRLTLGNGAAEHFDQVVLATHSDQALALLADPSPAEQAILGAIGYQKNVAILHTDETVMPKAKLAWASWNAHLPGRGAQRTAVTYWMNKLQSLDTRLQFFVTLNYDEAIRPDRILKTIEYHHPVYDRSAVAAQKRWGEISGQNHTHYCGAYWGFGFHEDGVKSALAVGQSFGKDLATCRAAFTKESFGIGDGDPPLTTSAIGCSW